MQKVSIAQLRREYGQKELTESKASRDPFGQFQKWLEEAIEADVLEPNAMVLSTVSPTGRVHSRVVLLKDFGKTGFVFYTSYESLKAKDIASNPEVSLLFFWPELERQVRIEGKAFLVAASEADEYFAIRPIEAKWAAWASRQSEVIPSRDYLEQKFKEVKEKFGENVPRPATWGGYRVIPDYFEFWQGRANRLHDRIAYQKQGDGWQILRLSP